MNDDVENPREEVVIDDHEGPVGGERLAEARRAKQVTVLEIAKELHLDETKVRALERNEFDVLGAPVFAKGHLKKYAQLVQVDPDDVLTDYYKLNRAAATPPVVPSRSKPRQELSPGPWIAGIVIIIMAVTGYWWFSSTPALPVTGDESTAVAQPAADSVALPAAEPAAEEALEAAQDAAVTEPDSAVPAEPEPESQPAAEPVTEQMPVTDDGQMLMLVTFSGDCWTEISDASGRRLLFALGQDGQTVELSGTAPFNVLFGNPDHVSVRVDGEDFALPATSRPGRALRLTISGS